MGRKWSWKEGKEMELEGRDEKVARKKGRKWS